MTTTKLKPADFKKEIISFFEEKMNMTIVEAKKIVKQRIEADEYDDGIRYSNVRIFYTSNSKFNGGSENGYGVGFYITNGNVQIKI